MSDKENDLDNAFKIGCNIENYFEIWEMARVKTDPLIEKWKDYIEKKKD